MTTRLFSAAALSLVCATASFAQPASVLLTAGYTETGATQVAPGQILTLFYRGIAPAANGEFRSAQAEAPLPTLLAGLSAQIQQASSLFNVPIVQVRQQNTCPAGLTGPACVLTAVKIQVPFEIAADVHQDMPPGPVSFAPEANLMFYADGQLTAASLLQPVPDNAHVLTACDSAWDTRPASVCDRQASHADGSPVNADAPAARGETITLLLYGLGRTAPAAPTGVQAEPGFFLTDILGTARVKTSFTSFVNALASSPRHIYIPSQEEIPAAVNGALRAGEVGIYQISVVVPDSAAPAVPCGSTVRSNYVLNVVTSQGSEIVPLCIAR